MNIHINPAQQKIPCDLWICASLDWFAKCHLQQLSAIFSNTDFDQQLATQLVIPLLELPQALAQLEVTKLDLPAPLVRLLEAGRISPPELFAAFFCAELNNNYWLNLALQELQGAQADSWPRLYFLCDLLNSISNVRITPADIAQWPLVKAGVLSVNGHGPLALAHLQLDLSRWQLLMQAASAYELIQFIGVTANRSAADSHSLSANKLSTNKLPANKSLAIQPLANDDHHSALNEFSLALRLQQLCCLHLCASLYSGRAFALALAGRLNLELVIPTAQALHQPAVLDLVCCAYGWLPLVEFSALAELSLAEASAQKLWLARGVVLHKDTIANTELELIQNQPLAAVYWLAQQPFAERIAAWQQWFDKTTAESFANRWLCNSTSIQLLMSRVEPGIAQQDTAAIEQAIKTARMQAAPTSLQHLAFLVPWQLTADAIVFTPKLGSDLSALKERCLQRQSLCDGLGKPLSATHNTGVRALLYGESGTGKTLAAVYLAAQLGAPLYRLDLGAVLNKYVGETEKNIHQLLAQAAEEDFILLIDEADALFAKRSDGESGGERFANMLTNYLLARIEQHPGIVLMTTNGLGRIDTAFMRRFDRVIEFQSPQLEERSRIWQQHLGARSPGEDYCCQLASLCDLTGGFIRNAVLAAAAEVPARRQLQLPYAVLLKAIAQEYRKSGKPVPPKLLNQLNVQLARHYESAAKEPVAKEPVRKEIAL